LAAGWRPRIGVRFPAGNRFPPCRNLTILGFKHFNKFHSTCYVSKWSVLFMFSWQLFSPLSLFRKIKGGLLIIFNLSDVRHKTYVIIDAIVHQNPPEAVGNITNCMEPSPPFEPLSGGVCKETLCLI
jgi:hypothetical protein